MYCKKSFEHSRISMCVCTSGILFKASQLQQSVYWKRPLRFHRKWNPVECTDLCPPLPLHVSCECGPGRYSSPTMEIQSTCISEWSPNHKRFRLSKPQVATAYNEPVKGEQVNNKMREVHNFRSKTEESFGTADCECVVICYQIKLLYFFYQMVRLFCIVDILYRFNWIVAFKLINSIYVDGDMVFGSLCRERQCGYVSKEGLIEMLLVK